MTIKASKPSKAKTRRRKAEPGAYHHGNLRAALLETAGEIIRVTGLHGLSLRDVARNAGVSNMAPYRHFDSKAALVAALAEEGFHDLTAAIKSAKANAGAAPQAQLQAAGVAYVIFAAKHPAEFRLMFGPREQYGDAPQVKEASRRSYQELYDCIAACQAEGLLNRDANPEAIGQTAWALVHGLATLIVDGAINVKTNKAVEAVVVQSQELLFKGISV